ncbi:hypothetical protein ACIBF1_14955 [Spirillospora sp. NPDC050679]
MARYAFGGGIADYVVRKGDSGALELFPDAAVTFWDAPVDGTQHTALIDATGIEIPAGVVRSDANGAIPAFGRGPEGVRAMWADASTDFKGPRRQIVTTDVADLLGDHLSRLAALEAKLDGIGRLTVAPTAPAAPAIGDIWFDTAAASGNAPLAFRAAGSVAADWQPGVTCPLPAELVTGDYLIAVLAMPASLGEAIATPPAGWTELVAPDVIADDTRVGVWGKVHAAGDAAPTWVYTTTAKGKATVSIAAYAGADGTPQVGAPAVRPGITSTVDAPGVTTAEPDMLVVCAYGEMSSAATAITEPAGTSRRSAQIGYGSKAVPSTLICDFAQPVPGATGVRTATWNSTSNNGLGVQIALRRRRG